jgi:hypothetical protein
MRFLFRTLSIFFFLAALLSIIALLAGDAWHGLKLTTLHQRAGAFALMLIGASYICLQLCRPRRWMEFIKGVLLGIAFLLWGGELFVQPGPWVTAMDSVVITIFVVDLSLIIYEHIQRRDHETP